MAGAFFGLLSNTLAQEVAMLEEERPEWKQVKLLKCAKCGRAYIFDSFSQRCPECGGTLQVQIVLK